MNCPFCSYQIVDPLGAEDEHCPECGQILLTARRKRLYSNALFLAGIVVCDVVLFGALSGAILLWRGWDVSVSWSPLCVDVARIGLASAMCATILVCRHPVKQTAISTAIAALISLISFRPLVFLFTPLVLWAAFVPAWLGSMGIGVTIGAVYGILRTSMVPRWVITLRNSDTGSGWRHP